MWKSCVECEETQLFENQRKCFGAMMVNVCACGPGQQHFPVGGSCPAAGCCCGSNDPQSNFSLVTLKLSWTGVETFPSAFGPQEQKELTF